MVTGGQDHTTPGYRNVLRWQGEVREALASPCECSCTGTDTAMLPLSWAGSGSPAVSTHPTTATPEAGHSADGTVLVALTVPQGGQVPLPVTSWRNKDLMLHHPKWYWALTCPSSGHCLTAFISLHFISLVLNSALLKLIKPPVTHTAYSSKSLQPKLFKPSTESSSPIKFAIGPKFVLLRVHFQIIVTTDFSENYF